MIVEPRRAAPGALRRWSRQSVALLARAPAFWLGLALLLCLAMFLSQRLPLVGAMLALIAFFSSTVLAAVLDRRLATSVDELLAALQGQGRVILTFGVVITVAGALIWILLLAKPGVPWWAVFWNERNVVAALSIDSWIALRQVFVYSAYALGLLYFGLNIPGLTSFLQFPCRTLLDLPFREAYRVAAAGQLLNLGPMLGVGLLFVLAPMLTVFVLPPAVPILYCFFGALAYVAFREIFLGVAENAALARTVLATARAG